MEEYFFPQPEWFLDAIHEKIIPLKGHKLTTDCSAEKAVKLNKEGV
jgi:2-oxoisovalerate dehydrogenase E1 component